MSALTKIAVVLLVVASLLLSAGVVVFVNKVEDFKSQGEASNIQFQKEQQANRVLVNENLTLRNQAAIDQTTANAKLDAAKAESLAKDAPKAKLEADLAALRQEKANVETALATMSGNQKGLQEQLDKSQAQVTNLRTAMDKVVSERFTINSQLTDALSKLDVVTRAYKDMQEKLTSKQAMYEDLNRKYTDLVGTSGIARNRTNEGTPALEGVVSGVFSAGGKPWASVTIGSKDLVEKGMQFKVINNNEFLGYLVIQTTEPNAAAGVLEGPKVEKVRQGDQVKTQLQ